MGRTAKTSKSMRGKKGSKEPDWVQPTEIVPNKDPAAEVVPGPSLTRRERNDHSRSDASDGVGGTNGVSRSGISPKIGPPTLTAENQDDRDVAGEALSQDEEGNPSQNENTEYEDQSDYEVTFRNSFRPLAEDTRYADCPRQAASSTRPTVVLKTREMNGNRSAVNEITENREGQAEYMRYLNDKRKTGELSEGEEIEICEFVMNKLKINNKENIDPKERNFVNSTYVVNKPLVEPKRRRETRRNRSTISTDTDSDDENEINKQSYRETGRGGHRRGFIKPGRFDGKSSWETFHAHFNNCADYNRWGTLDRLYQLRGALEGQAALVLISLDKNATYSQICEELKLCFGTEGTETQFESKLRTRKRGKNETLQSLYQDINTLVMYAYPGTKSRLRDRLAVDAFLQSLNDPDLELRVRDKTPSNLLECYTIATTLEANLKMVNGLDEASRRKERRDIQARAVIQGSEEQGSEGSSLMKQLEQLIKGLKEDANKRSQPNRGGNNVRSVGPTPSNNGNGFRPQWIPRPFPPMNANGVPSPAQADFMPHWQSDPNATVPMASAPPGPSGPNRNIQCYGCGQAGHIKRYCPQNQNRGPPVPRPTFVAPPQGFAPAGPERMMSARGVGSRRMRRLNYLSLVFEGKPHNFLLDTGCDITILPAFMTKGMRISPTTETVTAAKGTPIILKGEVKAKLEIGRHSVVVRALVSEYISEPLLGADFMEKHSVNWRIGEGKIEFKGDIFQLKEGPWCSPVCSRILMDGDVCIPGASEIIVTGKAVFEGFYVDRDAEGEDIPLLLEPKQLDNGLTVARALVPNRCHDIPVRIVNTSDKSLTLHRDCILAELEEPEQIIDEEPSANDRTNREWMEKLLEGVDSSLSVSDRELLRHILLSYQDCFSRSEYDLGCTAVVEHKIFTGDAPPFKQSLRRQPISYLPEIDKQVGEMLDQGIIEPSASPWTSNVVIAVKKDGSLRFCIDYRRLNDITRKDSYPLPRIADCLDALGNMKYFSAFDLRSGYHQIVMSPEDRDKTTFVTRSGTFRFKVMPFGLCNAPATFQRAMDFIMADLNYKICLVYLDDIILFSKTVDEHFDRLGQFLERLRRANLKLKPSKCQLFRKSVNFLGHIVSEEGISTDPEKVVKIKEWPTPENVTEVRAFLGLCSYYRRFVEGFALIAAPLHALTGKHVRFHWDEKCESAFVVLKEKLVSSPILAMPMDEGAFRLDTDASGNSIGAVLSQIQDGEEKVIAYGSRMLNGPEKNYCVTRRELLAVVFFVKYYRPYLLGREFVIRTDHSALQWLKSTPEPIGQQARWLEILEEFKYSIEHRAGRKHSNADALSRRPCRQCELDDRELSQIVLRTIHMNQPEEENEFSPERLRESYLTDPELARIYEMLVTNTEQVPWSQVVGMDKYTKAYWTIWSKLRIFHGVMYRQWISIDGTHSRWQLVPPINVRAHLIKLAHTGATGGHLGVKRTAAQLQLRAYWVGWNDSIAEYCRTCEDCACYHRGNPPKTGALQPLVTGEPFERIEIDLTGPHPTSKSGNIYILTIIDVFTKWAEALPIRNKEATTVARVLVDAFLVRFGMPIQILSDMGKEFENGILHEICRIMDIDKIKTTSYKPSTNGGIERFHRTLNAMIGKVVDRSQRDWDERLPAVMAAYRASKHEATGFSPNFLVLGEEVRAPLDLVLGEPVSEPGEISYEGFVEDKVKKMQEAYALVREKSTSECQSFKEVL